MISTVPACWFHDRVGYHEYEGLAIELDERERLVNDLGPVNHTLLLNNHGVVVTGPSIPCAFARFYYFEVAAGVQLKAMTSGKPLKRISEQVLLNTLKQFESFAEKSGSDAFPEWPAYLRMLDRMDPEWRS